MIPGLVSVITPTYNRPNYLREAVDSVFAQTYPSIEILIVDDGSSDGGAHTKSALKPYLSPKPSKMRKVTYLYQENGGLVSAVNRGLGLARGEYIQRLDDDDRLLPEKIARSVEVFQAHPAVGLVATGYHHIDAAGKRIHTCSPRPCSESARLFNMLLGCISTCAGVIVRSLVHQEVGVYRDIKAQDYEMWIRVAKKFKVETLYLPLAEYRRHPGNSTSPQNNQAQIERDILNFTREQIETTPLDELIPNLQSKPHAYALRAAIYLQKDSEHVRAVPFARTELKKGLQLAPNDPLLLLWKGVLAVHDGRKPPENTYFPPRYHKKMEALTRFNEERRRVSAQGLPPSCREAIDLRQRFGRFCSTLIRETFNSAVGKA